MATNRVEVTINSRQYAILAEESEDYIKKLASHINDKVRLVMKGGQNVMGERPMVLAALNICDEYYKCEEAGLVLKNQLEACTKKLNAANEELKRLKVSEPQISFDEQEAEEKLKNTEKELHTAEKQLKSAGERIADLEKRVKELEGRDNRYSGKGYNNQNGKKN